MFTADQLVAHAIGDYLIQSHWMATEKVKRWLPAVIHGLTYTIPFLFLTLSPLALLVIAGTHMVIDRYRLARYVVWAKNHVFASGDIYGEWAYQWKVNATGYPDDTPPWLAVWLLIIADNLIHVCINAVALRWLV